MLPRVEARRAHRSQRSSRQCPLGGPLRLERRLSARPSRGRRHAEARQSRAVGLATGAVVNGDEGALASGTLAVMDTALRAARTLPHRSDFAGWQRIAGRHEHRLALGALKSLAEQMGMTPGNKAITPIVERGSSEFYRGFLRGFFDADGSVQGRSAEGRERASRAVGPRPPASCPAYAAASWDRHVRSIAIAGGRQSTLLPDGQGRRASLRDQGAARAGRQRS